MNWGVSEVVLMSLPYFISQSGSDLVDNLLGGVLLGQNAVCAKIPLDFLGCAVCSVLQQHKMVPVPTLCITPYTHTIE